MRSSVSVSISEPWVKALHELRLQPICETTQLPYSVWLEWTPSLDATSLPGLLHNLQALELFVLLARTDIISFKKLIGELAASCDKPRAHAWETLLLASHRRIVVFGYDVICKQTDDARIFCDFMRTSTSDIDQGSESYEAVRASIEAHCDAETGEIPVRLRLRPERFWRGDQMAGLTSLVALAKLQRNFTAPANDKSGQRCHCTGLRSRIRYFHNDIPAFTRVDDSSLHQLVGIWSHGIHVVDLPRVQMNLEPANWSLYVRSLQSLFGVDCEGCIQRVFIGQPHQVATTPALLSAVAHSRTVREVSIDFDGIDGHEISTQHIRSTIQWVAYALFSAHANNDLRKITMECRFLTMEHVTIMRELLAASDPLTVLFPGLEDSILANDSVRVSASSLVLEDPTITDSTRCALDGVVIKNLRVLNHTNGWWQVLLPGWGPAWAQDGQVSLLQTSTTPVQPLIRSVSSVQILQLSADNSEAVIQLLRMVGDRTTTLRFADGFRPANSLCTELFEACPLMRDVELRGRVLDGFTVYVDSFINGRSRHLRRLDIVVEALTETALAELKELLRVLTDPSHPMTQTLEALEVDALCMKDSDEAAISDVLTVALEMLHKNMRLARLKLHLPLATSDMSGAQLLSSEFAKHQGTFLPAPQAPLGRREQRAFLSVVRKSTTTSRAIRKLDQHAILNIFEFVPDRRRREVDVAMPRSLVADE